jgi:hypothetical protein
MLLGVDEIGMKVPGVGKVWSSNPDVGSVFGIIGWDWNRTGLGLGLWVILGDDLGLAIGFWYWVLLGDGDELWMVPVGIDPGPWYPDGEILLGVGVELRFEVGTVLGDGCWLGSELGVGL